MQAAPSHRKKFPIGLTLLVILAVFGTAVLLLGMRSQRHLSAHEAVLRYMSDTYGEPDNKGERFGAQPGGAAPFVKLCAEREVAVKDIAHVLVAACEVDGSQGSDDLPASVDLAVLRLDDKGRPPTVVAKQDSVQTGGGDTRLRGASVVQLGPNFFGFRVETLYYAEGFDVSSATLYAPQGQTFKPVLELTLHADNGGTDCSTNPDHPCFSIDRQLTADASGNTGSPFPLRVVETRGNGTPRNAVFRFDRKRWQYVGPAGFEPTPSL